MAKYICFEGSEGVGKTTQVSKLVAHLRQQGYKVLETKEPGTVHSPVTMELRKLMLDAKYNNPNGTNQILLDLVVLMEKFHNELTLTAINLLSHQLPSDDLTSPVSANLRENISQAIRNIHLHKVIKPALDDFDFIVQDRGILSGLAYGVSCGVNEAFMNTNNNLSVTESEIASSWQDCYSQIILLQGNVSQGLSRALSAKQEFESGDVMESKGVSFLEKVNSNFNLYSKKFNNVSAIQVDGKSIDQVFNLICQKVL